MDNAQQPPDFNPCGVGLFHCGDSLCIPQTRVCDRVPDCPGYNPEDERGCLELCKSPGYFPCGDGHCIFGEQLCNGVVDCRTGADEGLSGGCGFTSFVRTLIIWMSVIFVIVSVCLAIYIVVKRRLNRRRMISIRVLATQGPEALEPTFKKAPPTSAKCTIETGYYDDETFSVCSADDALLLDQTKRKKIGAMS